MKSTYVFELEDELLDYRWDAVVRQVGDASSLLYAIWSYILDSDGYYLAELRELYLGGDHGSELWFYLSDWADDAFELWEDRVQLLRLEYYGQLRAVVFSKTASSYALTFGEDDDDDPLPAI